MNHFERITASPEALGAFLASIPAANTPWDDCFSKTFCAGCDRDDCDTEPCPHQAERNNPTWWLKQEVGERNLNWAMLPIPKNCDSIFICADSEQFDGWKEAGMIPLLDPRNTKEKDFISVFVGYAPIPGLKFVDALLAPREAKSDGAIPTDLHDLGGP